MKESIVKDKSFDFALKIIDLRRMLEEKREFVIARQIMRSGTSIGANVREAEYAVSRADFINKLSIALKEANETEYWLELLRYSKTIEKELFEEYNQALKEILRLLISIIKKSKEKLKNK